MIKILALLFTILCLTTNIEAQETGFPKMLWTFWDGDLSNPNSQVFLKLCLNNMDQYCRKSGWEFNLVTYDNLRQFLSPENYAECLRLLDGINFEFKQMRADIIRLELLKQNGGMWVDSSTFFVEELSWVNSIADQNIPILNKISENPDLLTFRLYEYDKPDGWVYDASLDQSIHLSPGIENWAIIAKKNAPFVRDSLKIIEEIIFGDEEELQQKIQENKVVLSSKAKNTYFRFGIYTFQLVMQFKQRQLDLLNEKKNQDTTQVLPKYAVEYYKLWTLSCDDMGFNLEKITDGIMPFFPYLFLSASTQIIDQYNLKLKGFVKLGGLKRKYMQMILETIVDPSMCWIVFQESHRITNQSYLYKKMIEDNQSPTGLVLKQQINQMNTVGSDRQNICQLSTQTPELKSIMTLTNGLIIYTCLYVAFLFFLSFLWIKCNNLINVPKGVSFLLLAIILGVYVTTYAPVHSLESTCSQFSVQSNTYEIQKAQKYVGQMRYRLPKDNGSMLRMYFQQYGQKLTDDFSSFWSNHAAQYIRYFWKYILGFGFILILIIVSIFKPKRVVQIVAVEERRRKALTNIKKGLLAILFLGSLLVLSSSFSLNKRVKQSICYVASLPKFFSNQRQFPNKSTQQKQMNPDKLKGIQQSEFIKIGYFEYATLFQERFEQISLLIIALKESQKQSQNYLKELSDIQQSLDTSQENQELATLFSTKLALLTTFQQNLRNVESTMVCQNRVIETTKLISDNLKNLGAMLSFFFDNFLPLETISFLATGILVAMSIIFCVFSMILGLRSLKIYQPENPNNNREKTTFAILGFVGLSLSLTLNTVILPNYYFCDFVVTSGNSIKDSSGFLQNVFPLKCMSDTFSDFMIKEFDQNFELRNKPYRDFLKLSDKMDPIMSYPYEKENQLLQKSSVRQNTNFISSNQRYNKIIHSSSTKYYEKQQTLQQALEVKYNVIANKFIDDVETIAFQPTCVFGFNALYQMTNYFAYLGLLNLLAFTISILLECDATPCDVILDDDMSQQSSATVKDDFNSKDSKSERESGSSFIKIDKKISQSKLTDENNDY